jgi:hypothetical protein
MNTLAFYNAELITSVKSFIVQIHEYLVEWIKTTFLKPGCGLLNKNFTPEIKMNHSLSVTLSLALASVTNYDHK